MGKEKEFNAKPLGTRSKKGTPSKPTVNLEFPSQRDEGVTGNATVATANNAIIKGNPAILLDEVRKRAYELYEQRGRLEGFHEEDWFRAESELRNPSHSGQRLGPKNSPEQKKTA